MNHLELQQTKILSREPLGPDSWTLKLEKLCHFTPGQVIGLTFDPTQPVRYYSLSSGSSDPQWEILFKLAPGGQLTGKLGAEPIGSTIWSTLPQGTFIQRPGPSVWIAGGTGVAPFLSMVRSGMKAVLIQGGRELDSLYFSQYFQQQLGTSYQGCCSTQAVHGVEKIRLIEHLKNTPLDTTKNYYLCGSAVMVVEVRDLLISRKIPYERIYSEIYF